MKMNGAAVRAAKGRRVTCAVKNGNPTLRYTANDGAYSVEIGAGCPPAFGKPVRTGVGGQILPLENYVLVYDRGKISVYPAAPSP